MLKRLGWLVAAIALTGATPVFAQAPPPYQASAERPILLLAQVLSGPVDPALMLKIQPLKTMEEVQVFLRTNGIPYSRRRVQLDTRITEKPLLDMIAGLPRDEIFVIPQGGNLLFNQVVRALTPDDSHQIENW